MPFTDQKPRIATAEECQAPWSGGKLGKYFRCYLCGHKFAVGDRWRWVYAISIHLPNFSVCEGCDGPDVLARWKAANEELEQRFWWAIRDRE